jgi:aldehyde:ferredoxin oxidoreductase
MNSNLASTLSPENVFIVGIGPLAGTLAPCGTRWTVTAKAPLTGYSVTGAVVATLRLN